MIAITYPLFGLDFTYPTSSSRMSPKPSLLFSTTKMRKAFEEYLSYKIECEKFFLNATNNVSVVHVKKMRSNV